MKRFKGFSNDQTHQLLKEFGYTGPAQKDDMDAFLASSPRAASQLGRYADIAKQRVEGGPLSGIGMQAGGNIANTEQRERLNEQILDSIRSRGGRPTGAEGVGFDGKPIDPNDPFQGNPAIMPDFSKYKPVSRITDTPTVKTGFDPSQEFLVGLGGGVRNPDYTGPISDRSRTLQELAPTARQGTAEDKASFQDIMRSALGTEQDPPTEEPQQVNPLERLSPKIQEAMREAKTTFNPDNLSTATQDLITASEAKSKEAGDISSRLTQEFYATQMYSGTHPSGRRPMTPEVGEEMRAFIENNPEFKAAKEEAEKAARDASTAVEGDPAYQTFVQSTQAPEGSQVLQPGTPTPEITEASQLLDEAQKTLADTTRNLTKVQQDMSGKDPEDIYYRRDDYTSVADGTQEERNAVGVELSEKLYAHLVGLQELTPEEISKFDVNGDGQITNSDANAYKEMSSQIEPNDAFTEFFLNKYPGGPVTYKQALEDAQLAQTNASSNVKTQEAAYKIEDVPSTAEALGKAITNPSSILQKPTVYGLKVEDGQLIDEGTGQVATAATLLVKQAQDAGEADDPAVKATMAYVQGLDDEEFRPGGKYPPYPKAIPMVTPLPESTVKDIADYYDRQQAQIAQDAKKDTAETFTAVKSEDKIKAIDELGDFAEGVLSDEAKMQAAEMTPTDLEQLKGKYADPAKLESYNIVLNEDDIVRINQDREELKVAMTAARLDGDTEGFAALKEAYDKAGDSVRKAYETGTVVGDLKEDTREFPNAALFSELGGYTEAEAAEVEKETAIGELEEISPSKFEGDTPRADPKIDYNLPPTEIAKQEENKVKDAADFDEYASAPEKKSEFVPDIDPEETTVGDDEIVDVNDIINEEPIIIQAKTLEALNGDAVAKAATASFTQQLEAKKVTGTVSATSTVQGQMEKLMNQFNDGTPAWAAGALRKVTAAMNARGLGGSSMAGAAMIQAAMESAIPIAQSDAATYAAMDMENVRNEQAVALANAAAAQNFKLQNLSNKQAVRIQNSMNNANLQLQNLSNEQEAVLAAAQFKASLQGQELSISANVAIANAARYAAVNDINLTNRQQTSILKSTQNLEVEMANLSNEQQTALSNLQVKAAMMGQELTNEQQMAVLESTQAFEANMGDATRKQQAFIQDAVATAAMEGRVLDNKQQTALFNVANQVAEREIELNNEQQTAIFNMSNKMTIATEEMSARQQTALANAQIEAAMKGQELSNKQQVAVIKSERIAEIANMNFTAEQSRALQNAQLTQTVDLANLSNTQAKLLADCAALTDVDMANLNNRQQAQAQQAQAFLQMDMANLDNEQQAVMFEAQSLVQSVFSDQAAENAQLQFNAESINQVNQFFDSLSTQVSQFNIAQSNAMEQFNAGEEISMTKFQAELDNQRDLFNSQNELVIAQANTAWRQAIATANTAALNEANMAEVMAANNMSMQGLAELWQQERDLMNFAWTTAENAMTRDQELVIAKLKEDGNADTAFMSSAGGFLSAIVGAFAPTFGGTKTTTTTTTTAAE